MRRRRCYEYFLCRKGQQHICQQPTHCAEAVEAGVEKEYARLELTRPGRERITRALHAMFAQIADAASDQRAQADKDLERLQREERALLRRDAEGRVSDELYAEESDRIARERVAIKVLKARLDIDLDKASYGIDLCLGLTEDIHRAYLQADGEQRRLFNQAFFERIYIDNEQIGATTLAEPFVTMLDPTLPDLAVEGLLDRAWSMDVLPLMAEAHRLVLASRSAS